MKEIRNKTGRPVRVPLPGGKVLHLGPAMVAQISDGALERENVQKLVKDGTIEVVGEGERTGSSGGTGSGPERTRGRGKTPFRRSHGDR
jgi:hypothetical protein